VISFAPEAPDSRPAPCSESTGRGLSRARHQDHLAQGQKDDGRAGRFNCRPLVNRRPELDWRGFLNVDDKPSAGLLAAQTRPPLLLMVVAG